MRYLAFILGLLAGPLWAHEFWIEPLEYQIAPDRNLQAHIVNGQEFEGTRLPYVPQRFAGFVNYVGDQRQAVSGRIGDLPALNIAPVAEGLNVIAYQAHYATVDYDNWDKFQKFVEHKDLGDVRTRHLARGLPEEQVKEIYARFSKSLIGVGSSIGSDARIGMVTEFVALTNPYTDDLSSGMKVQLFYQNDIRADVQVEVFEKSASGNVSITTHRTDAQGIATIPVSAGHSYMIDAVVLRETRPDLAAHSGMHWETLWANLTFAVP